MSVFQNPFEKGTAIPGSGEVHVTLLPPAKPVFKTLTYSYPLKLIPSSPHHLGDTEQLNTNTRDQGVVRTSKVTNNGISIGTDTNGIDGNITESNSNTVALPTRPDSVPLLFLLSYGGGLLPPDVIDLRVTLDPHVRLTITTQGSTKIFPSRVNQKARAEDDGAVMDAGKGQRSTGTSTSTPSIPKAVLGTDDGYIDNGAGEGEGRIGTLPTAYQKLHVQVGPYAALCLTPDPSQPFNGSRYEQHQCFVLHPTSSLLLLDWTNEGRRARGESWDALLWRGCNEIWLQADEAPDDTSNNTNINANLNPNSDAANGKIPLAERMRSLVRKDGRLLQLRDQVILEADGQGPSGLSGRGMEALKTEQLGCFGTLVIVGSLVKPLGDFFVEEFEALPRIGGRRWDDDDDGEEGDGSHVYEKQGGSGRKNGRGNGHEEGEDEETYKAARRRKERLAWRQRRLKLENEERVLWNAARVRGLVMVKFVARDSQGARHWLGQMLNFEGTVLREFGPGGLMSVR